MEKAVDEPLEHPGDCIDDGRPEGACHVISTGLGRGPVGPNPAILGTSHYITHEVKTWKGHDL